MKLPTPYHLTETKPVTYCQTIQRQHDPLSCSESWGTDILWAMQRPSDTQPSSPLTISVVLFHSSLDELRALIESVVSGLESAQLYNVDFVLVDHSGSDTYAEQCRAALAAFDDHPRVQLHLRLRPINAGYGAGHNYAISEFPGQFHLILNPDVEVDEKAIELLLGAMKADSNIALLAPLGFNSIGEPEFLAKAYPSVSVLGLRAFAPRWLKTHYAHAMARYELRDVADQPIMRPVTLASGCCMFVRRDVFDKVGGFDESYFLYFEDYDLSLKMAQHGVVMEHRGARIMHHGGNAARKGWRHRWWFVSGARRFFNCWGWKWLG